MNGYLLDTHVLLWLLEDSPKLDRGLKDLFAEAERLYASAASLWELAIKSGLGQVVLPDGFVDEIGRAGIVELPVGFEHAMGVRELPALHRDPFDRLLVAQAQAEGLVLVTRDEVLTRYPVAFLRA
ncbi:MAG: type II toxin-antitoxin system VapC family toxin [Phycisphaeraceae bacterium]